VQLLPLHDQPEPLIDVIVRPVVTVSVTVTVPDVASAFAPFETVTE
jgi:hypothetical protein